MFLIQRLEHSPVEYDPRFHGAIERLERFEHPGGSPV